MNIVVLIGIIITVAIVNVNFCFFRIHISIIIRQYCCTNGTSSG